LLKKILNKIEEATYGQALASVAVALRRSQQQILASIVNDAHPVTNDEAIAVHFSAKVSQEYVAWPHIQSKFRRGKTVGPPWHRFWYPVATGGFVAALARVALLIPSMFLWKGAALG
jgi:hypothetical protein